MTMELVGEAKAEVEREYGLMIRSTSIAFAGGLLFAFVLGCALSAGTPGVMSLTNPTLILYPSFAMFFLVALVLTRMGFVRVTAVRTGEIDMRYYRTFSEGEEPEHMRVVTRHFLNLFEMPLLLHVVVILAFITHLVSAFLVGLAWAYVVLRYAHAYIHLTTNHVPTRLSAYASSGLVLLVMWVTLLIQLLRSSAV